MAVLCSAEQNSGGYEDKTDAVSIFAAHFCIATGQLKEVCCLLYVNLKIYHNSVYKIHLLQMGETRSSDLTLSPVLQPHFFYLAPIRGVTDALFRNIFHSHFPNFDAAVAPFINPQRFANLKDKFLVDVLPENNTSLPLIPQLLYNTPDDFINLGNKLADYGYNHINWNLGCPAPMVANKKRGSGLLPHTDRIIKLLDAVTAALDTEISIKTRLGFQEPTDLHRLLPMLEHYPLKEIIIHPRIGKQLYRGSVNLSGFAECLRLTSHKIVYNGDICRKNDFLKLTTMFPDINRWMVGRGAIADPFLIAEINGVRFTPEQRLQKLADFHSDIFQQLQERLSGPGHLLNRLKQIWAYLIDSFQGNQKLLKKIHKASTVPKYQDAVQQVFDRQAKTIATPSNLYSSHP